MPRAGRTFEEGRIYHVYNRVGGGWMAFGIMSHNAAQRTRDRTRVAFGAVPPDLISMVLRQALRLAVFGLVLGPILFALSAGVIKNQLYGVGSIAATPLGGANLWNDRGS